MCSFEEDLLALTDDDDEDLGQPRRRSNPVEEHLAERLMDLEDRLRDGRIRIEETRNTSRSILRSLQSEARYEDGATSDEDVDLYTMDGQPRIKKRRQRIHRQILRVDGSWCRVLLDRWVVGVDLQNTTTTERLTDVRLYVDLEDEPVVTGETILWRLPEDSPSYEATDTIEPGSKATATVQLDLAGYQDGHRTVRNCRGTIWYRADEDREYQAPLVPRVSLSIEDTLVRGLDFAESTRESVLAVRAASRTSRILGLDLGTDTERGARLLALLGDLNFVEVCADVYVVQEAGCLMYCLVEVLPIVQDEARLRMSCGSEAQANVALRLMRNEFPELTVHEEDACALAAAALIRELEIHLYGGTVAERQRARIRTDLLVP